MSSNALLVPYKIYEAGTENTPIILNQDRVGQATRIYTISNVSYQVSAVGNAVGTVVIEGSNDGVNWTAFSDTGAFEGADKVILFDLNQLSFMYTRPVLTRASGSSVIEILVAGKGL